MADVVLARGPHHAEDELELVEVVLPREEVPAGEHLREDAPHGPDVDGEGVLVHREHQLRGAVPAGRHVLGHERGVVLGGGREPAGHPEVADLEFAVAVDQEVARLEVPVEYAGGVDVLQPPEYLVEKILDVLVAEGLHRVDDVVEVALHEVQHDVDVFEGRAILGGLHHVQDRDDVLVTQVPEDLELAVRPLGDGGYLEYLRDLLDGDPEARPVVHGRAHNAVGTRPNALQGGVARVHLELDGNVVVLDRLHPLVRHLTGPVGGRQRGET